MKRKKANKIESFHIAQFWCPQLRKDLSFWVDDREPENDKSDKSEKSESHGNETEKEDVKIQDNSKQNIVKKYFG